MRPFFIAGILVIALTAGAANAPPASAAAYSEKIPGSTVSIDMVPTPAGQFKPEGKPPVQIKALYVSTTEVSWDAYDIFCFQLDMTDKEKAAGVDAKSRPSRPYGDQTHGFGHAHYPAIHITRYAAEGFCAWLSKKTGHTYRLPTEAEWTYLCRCGGDGHVDDLDKVAWFADNSDDKTHPVGKKQPNAWGLYDMLGNAAEYVEIPGEPKDAKPTACGGSYDDDAKDITCNARKVQTADWNSTDPQNPKSKWWLSDGPFVGFRIVREQ